MENASKALLIAGAVLIVIAIISVGMFAVNKSRNLQDTGNREIDSFTIQMHNKMFEKYVGSNLPYKTVKSCITDVMNNNSGENLTNMDIRFSSKRNDVINTSVNTLVDSLEEMKKVLNGNSKLVRRIRCWRKI